MGYTTTFNGVLTITPPLDPAQVIYINKFAETRRMLRDERLTVKRPDPIREAVGLPVGEYGQYFVGGEGYAGQERSDDVLDFNTPPPSQPGLWCQWVVDDFGEALSWDGQEKFYAYTEWLQYLIDHFFARWGRTLSGEIEWQGEEGPDMGTIFVKNNKVEAIPKVITQERPSWL